MSDTTSNSLPILLIEDEEYIASTLILYLQDVGFNVVWKKNGVEGLTEALAKDYALLILDLVLPGMDGLEVCRQLREKKNLPIIMLTARSTEDDKILGLDSGADDYLCKPFSPRELVSRVNAILRRTLFSAEQKNSLLSFDGLELNLTCREVLVRGEIVSLTQTEYELLSLFCLSPNKVFSRAELLDKALPDALETFDRTIDTHIANLRRKIEPNKSELTFIKTEFGAGYRFVGKKCAE